MNILYKNGKLSADQSRFMMPKRPKEELYDLYTDPFELNNLTSNPDYKGILEEMNNVLNKWIINTDDKGEIPEDPKEQKYSIDMMYRKYARRMTDQGVSPDISDEDYLYFWEALL